MAPAFEVRTEIAAAPERVFELALDTGIHARSLAGTAERVVAAPRSGRLGAGDDVTWSARHFGIRWRMTSRITEYDRPRRFVDEQVRGPFASFRHEHEFTGGHENTEMIDRVWFSAPFGPVGRLAERAVLARYLEGLITTRAAHLRSVAEAPDTMRP